MKTSFRDINVLVTRPTQQADHLIKAIKEVGGQCAHFPLLDIQPVINPATKQVLQTINDYDAVICISQNAAQFGLAQLSELSITPASHIQWFAMGSSSANLLAQHGLSAITPEHAGTSESLLTLPWFASISHKRIMIWKGVSGRELLEQTLITKAADVVNVELYQRVMPIYAANALYEVLIENAINIIMITSGQALENLWQLAGNKTRIIHAVVVMVPSERVADQARALGIQQVVCAHGADDQSMLTCLQQYQTQTVRSV
jgi:uroporphyrinogen-III synthase